MHKAGVRLLASILLLISLACSGCAFGYKEAAEAAMSPLNPRTLAEDDRLKLALREAIVQNESFSGLALTPAVFMGNGFIIGFVDSPEQALKVVAAGKQVNGLRSLDTYLPVRPTKDSLTSDLETKGEVKGQIAIDPMLVSTRYTIEALDGVVVLLGVTMTEEERDAVAKVARGTSGVKDVKNFLMVVEPGYGTMRPHLR